jgi:hypothetical protein
MGGSSDLECGKEACDPAAGVQLEKRRVTVSGGGVDPMRSFPRYARTQNAEAHMCGAVSTYAPQTVNPGVVAGKRAEDGTDKGHNHGKRNGDSHWIPVAQEVGDVAAS